MFKLRKLITCWSRLLVVIVLGGVLWPGVVSQAAFVKCNPTPRVNPNGVPYIANQCTFDDLMAVPVDVFNWLLGMAGIVFLGVVIWGGARMMLYYASESPETELNDAKMTIRRGIFGLLIIAFSYVIVGVLVYKIFGVYTNTRLGSLLYLFGISRPY